MPERRGCGTVGRKWSEHPPSPRQNPASAALKQNERKKAKETQTTCHPTNKQLATSDAQKRKAQGKKMFNLFFLSSRNVTTNVTTNNYIHSVETRGAIEKRKCRCGGRKSLSTSTFRKTTPQLKHERLKMPTHSFLERDKCAGTGEERLKKNKTSCDTKSRRYSRQKPTTYMREVEASSNTQKNEWGREPLDPKRLAGHEE